MAEHHDQAELSERGESLWLLVAAPTVWAVHFLLCYLTAAIWCAKVVGRLGPLDTVQVLIAVYTALALLGIGITGWSGWRRHEYGAAAAPHDFDTPEDRHRFLGFATLLLSGLSAVAVVYVALTAVFIGTCH